MLQNLDNDKAMCVICTKEQRNATFYRCGHKISCISCAKTLKSQSHPMKCPICREVVVDIIKSYDV